MIGASFDTPEENKIFAEENQFGYHLLSDPDKAVGTLYEVTRDPSDEKAGYPLRIGYLIDPDGVIREAYEVTDIGGFAEQVVNDLQDLQR